MKTSILEEIHPQYIIDEKGKKNAVILNIEIYERLLEELEDMYLGKSAEETLKNDNERYSLEEIKKDLLK